MKNTILFVCFIFGLLSCKDYFSDKKNAIPLDTHEIVVKELVNSGTYTYALVSENDSNQWIVLPRTEIDLGARYFYRGGVLLNNFESKELNRTFEKILFIDGLCDDRRKLFKKSASEKLKFGREHKHRNLNTVNLKKIKIQPKKTVGGITIAELYLNRKQYTGKRVKIWGMVTKFSPDIMKKNWIHLQDGTEHAGKFDLTLTSNAFVAPGDSIIVEGEIFIDKDLGYGYFYEVLMEDAIIAN